MEDGFLIPAGPQRRRVLLPLQLASAGLPPVAACLLACSLARFLRFFDVTKWRSVRVNWTDFRLQVVQVRQVRLLGI